MNKQTNKKQNQIYKYREQTDHCQRGRGQKVRQNECKGERDTGLQVQNG